jgi:hypothetical protein
VLAVMQADRQHCDEIAVRLAGFNPAAYLGWDASRLAGALRGQGVDVPKSLKVGRINKTGVRRNAINGVLDARAIDSA